MMTCPNCDGEGEVTIEHPDYDFNGRMYTEKCYLCDGTGQIEEE